jgi:hypothetical protein
MPIHDWRRVDPGVFHSFHIAWVAELNRALNRGLLPGDHYALIEQTDPPVPPSVVVRREKAHRTVARVEVLSPGSKDDRHELDSFLDRTVADLESGCHLLLIDLVPPGPHDPQGVHGALWQKVADSGYEAPPDRPLTLASYDAGPPLAAYVQPVSAGDALPDMPLFLQPETYVNVPLEATYRGAWEGVPRRCRRVLDAPPGAG